MRTKTANLICCGILLWGFSAMAGHIIHSPALKGLGLASVIAPYTKVFCVAESIDDQRRFETFAADFTLHYQASNGQHHALRITPEIYQKVVGPYNRRNVYGAVLAYGPALPVQIQKQTIRYALLDPGKIPHELGLPADAEKFEIHIRSNTAGSTDTWVITP